MQGLAGPSRGSLPHCRANRRFSYEAWHDRVAGVAVGRGAAGPRESKRAAPLGQNHGTKTAIKVGYLHIRPSPIALKFCTFV